MWIHVMGVCLMVALIPPIRQRVGFGLDTLNRPACQGLLVLGAALWSSGDGRVLGMALNVNSVPGMVLGALLWLGVGGAFVAAIGIGVYEAIDRYRAHRRAQLPGRPWWV
jgi:hypothetical protein